MSDSIFRSRDLSLGGAVRRARTRKPRRPYSRCGTASEDPQNRYEREIRRHVTKLHRPCGVETLITGHAAEEAILVRQRTGLVVPVSFNLVLLTGAFMRAAFINRIHETSLRLARRFRGWRTAALVRVAVGMCLAAVMVPVVVFGGWLTAQASAWSEVRVARLAPAPGQPNPTDLWRSTPIPAVVAAVKSAERNAPMPTPIVPSMQELEGENATGDGVVPEGCLPTFGSGATSNVCRLGDESSARVVVVFGDSQAGTWLPGLAAVGRAQRFAVVPLVKPGCFVVRVKTNLPGWPCADWYRWALAQDKALHPVATVVSFLLWAPLEQHPASTASYMRFVLSHVRNGVFLADHPMQNREPSACIYKSDANMRKCSVRVPSTYVTLMKALARMTERTHHLAIPSLQWFCADGICPMVINHTLTTRDRDHMTKEYSAALAPLLGLDLKPILARLERR